MARLPLGSETAPARHRFRTTHVLFTVVALAVFLLPGIPTASSASSGWVSKTPDSVDFGDVPARLSSDTCGSAYFWE